MNRKLFINDNMEESDLFLLIQKGSKDAFTVIYEKYYKMLYLLSFRYLKDREKSEDTVQYAFTKLWEFHSDISVQVNLKNYLYTMTKNYILNQIRNENNALANNYKLAQSIDEYEDNLIEVIERKELNQIFSKALAALPEQKRKVCLYKMDEKLSNQDIADKMDISINTVKTHYAQSIKILRQHIEKMLIFILALILL